MSLIIGVDIDSYALHLCAIRPDREEPPRVVTVPLRKKKGQDEHEAILAVGHAFATGCATIRDIAVVTGGMGAVAANVYEPVTDVYVERGFGASRRADFVLGAIYGAVFVACRHALPNAACRPMLASAWKKHVTGAVGITTKKGDEGNGNASKADANQACRQIWEGRWPLAILPADPNQLDAFGVAYTGTSL